MKVESARYISDYKVELEFDDKKRNTIDFLPAIQQLPACRKFLDLSKFKKFKIEKGNIVWGKNWDMIFTIESLYNNKLI